MTRLYDVATYKVTIYVFTAVKTSNITFLLVFYMTLSYFLS